MGCIGSTVEKTFDQEPVFSWDREDRPDPKDYTIANKSNGTFGRLPGKINGQQFIIENCKDCSIYLFDNSATVTVDNCENCNIFVGPSKGSVFVRNCNSCLFYIACQQFRARECRKNTIFLFCVTQPIIELSAGMKFKCFQVSYPELDQQFMNADMSLFNNSWYKVHDFTPLNEGRNWSTIEETSTCFPEPLGEEFSSMRISYDPLKSIVPLTVGKYHTLKYDDSHLVVFFHSVKSKCQEFLKVLTEVTSYDIIQSQEIRLSTQDSSRIFKQDKYTKLVDDGPLVGLEVNGANIVQFGHEILQKLGINVDHVYISLDQDSAQEDIDAFFNFVNMSLMM